MMRSVTESAGENKRSAVIFALYTLVVVAIYVLPITKFLFPYIPVAIAMLVSLPVLMLKNERYMNYGVLTLAVSFFLAFIIFAAGESLVGAVNEGVRNIRFFIPVIWGMFALQFCDRKACNWILIFIGIVLTYIFIKTMIELENDPWIARQLAQGKESSSYEVNTYRLNNIGGFEFSYMIGIVTLCIVWTALSVKKKLVKIVCAVAAILCFYYIIKTMYTTLLLVTFIGALSLIIIKVKSIEAKLFWIFGCFLLVALMFNNLFEWISELFPEESLLSTKFLNIHNAIINDDISEVGSRPQLIFSSLEKWGKNPIFGKFSSNSNAHSMMISMLEHTGIVGFGMWILLFIASFVVLNKQMKEAKLDTRLFTVAFLYLLVLSFFNPIGYVFEVTIAAFFIVPIWAKILFVSNKGDEINEILEN